MAELKSYKDVGQVQDRVIEECSEVIHAICKAERFGLFNSHQSYDSGRANIYRIMDEIKDAQRVLDEYEKFLKISLRAYEAKK